MNTQDTERRFETLAQRVAYSYIRGLRCVPAGSDPAQRDLRAFYENLYGKLFAAPGDFGLPLAEDAFIRGDEPNGTALKAEINSKLKRPRDMLAGGLGFLRRLGQAGRLEGDTLALDESAYNAALKELKVKKPFLQGLERAGLTITQNGAQVTLTSPTFPAMLPALQALAQGCSRYSDGLLGSFQFARCDFRALDGSFHPSPLDLYTFFNTAEYERLARLHAFFSALKYKPVFQIHAVSAWEVQYQGRRAVKSSPLLRVEYQERFLNPLRVDLKCASTDRIVGLLPGQPQFLQEDFARRAYTCRQDECRWCDNRKGLGPSTLVVNGEQRQVCWYSNAEVRLLDDPAVELIEQYARMHEQLG